MTDEAFATITMTFDSTSNPKVSNLDNIAFALNLNPPVVKLASSTIPVNEGAGFAAVTFERTGDTSLPATLDYTTSGVTGTAPCSQAGPSGERCDFTTTLGTVRFETGETTKQIRVPIIDDNYAEANETFKLIIGNPVGAALKLPGAAVITITDNDPTTDPTNPWTMLTPQFFVRQQYLDLLSREPSPVEIAAGMSPIAACGSDKTCRRTKRIDLSQTIMAESHKAAGFVFRLYRAAFGNSQPFPNPDTANTSESNKWPSYAAISRDRALIVDGPNFAQSQLDLANSFVLRKAFTSKYSPATLTDGPAFVDAILATITTNLGVNLTSQRAALINVYDLAGGTSAGRAAVLYRLAESSANNPVNNVPFINSEDNRAFAAGLHLGYLKRDGDVVALNSLVTQLQSVQDRRGFIDQFVTGTEYRLRFGPTGGSASVSGLVTYGTTPSGTSAKFVPGVAFAAAGSTPLNAASNSVGAYSLNGFGPGAYTITPTKSGDTNGISGLDAAPRRAACGRFDSSDTEPDRRRRRYEQRRAVRSRRRAHRSDGGRDSKHWYSQPMEVHSGVPQLPECGRYADE